MGLECLDAVILVFPALGAMRCDRHTERLATGSRKVGVLKLAFEK